MRKRGITLQDALTIVMILWLSLSILALLIDIYLALHHISKGNYNITIPLRIGITLPLGP
ncbi:hypothetical protein [Ignicoccus hospitalis]|uniref:hypothetical protein n=1 Tax=Ignicoccus hospitalis TaxID=160233 RepID=UPI000322744C|nr:hypothetical protein [Ignicoccus hospitalis]